MLRPYLQLPRAVHILCLGTFVNRAGTFLIPFLTIYLSTKLDLSPRTATLTMGLYGLGAIVASVMGGHLADWIGRRRVMLISLFGGGASLFVFSFLSSATAVMATVTAFGIIAEMYRPAASAMIGDLVEPARRPHAFGLLYVAINLGFAVGPVIGGLIAAYSFRLLFWGDAVTSCMYGLIIFYFIKESMPSKLKPSATEPTAESTMGMASAEGMESPAVEYATVHEEPHVPLGEAVMHILRDRPFQVFCFAGFILAVIFMQSMSTFPLYLAERGIEAKTYGRLIAINGVMIVALQLPVTAFLSRFDRSLVVAVGAIVTGIGFAMTGLASSVPMFAATICIWTLGEIMQSSYLFAIATDLAPARMRGRYMGMFGMSHSLAMTLGVPLGGEVLTRLGGGFLWSGCMALGIFSALLYLGIRKHTRARVATH